MLDKLKSYSDECLRGIQLYETQRLIYIISRVYDQNGSKFLPPWYMVQGPQLPSAPKRTHAQYVGQCNHLSVSGQLHEYQNVGCMDLVIFDASMWTLRRITKDFRVYYTRKVLECDVN